jgi:hypothetical protein
MRWPALRRFTEQYRYVAAKATPLKIHGLTDM